MTDEPRWRRHLAWAAVVAAYLCVFPYFRAVNNPNENVRIWATRAIAHHGTFSIDPVIAEWGDVGDRAAAGGKRFSSKAPGTSLLGVPVHFVHDRLSLLITGYPPSPRATTWVLRVFTVILPLALFFFWFARRLEAETGSPFARDLLLVGLGLGTMLYPYGLAFVGHAQSAALLFIGFGLLTRPALLADDAAWDRRRTRRLVLAGLFTGLSVVFEYQSLFAAVVVAGYAALIERRRVLPFLLGALGPALLLGAYHTALFGRPWTLPYAHLDDPGFSLYHHSQGFLGLGRPRARVLVAASVHTDYGLFVFTPFLAVGLALSIWMALRKGSRPHAVIALVTAAMAIFLAGMANWRGGWCAGGPRYIAAVVPLLAFSLALGWRSVFAPRPLLAGALAGLVLFSVVVCGLSGAVFPHFPLQFDNPIFDLVLPLLRRGFAPYSLGTALGLSGAVSLLPLLLLFLVAIGALLTARDPASGQQRTHPTPADRRGGPGRAALAVGLATALIGALALSNRRPTREEARVRQLVIDMWEPPPPGGARGNP